MSPNHLGLDQAIQELWEERPAADRRARSLDALLRPRRNRIKLPGLAAAAALIIGLWLLVPTHGSGLAWAEVMRKTEQSKYLHITSFDNAGRVIGEQWRDGAMWAAYGKDKGGRMLYEDRCDDHHFYFYLYRRERTNPNAQQYATLGNMTPQMLSGQRQFGGPAQTIVDLLKSKGIQVRSQEKVEVDGTLVERYLLNMYGKDVTVDVKPEDGRILFVRHSDETAKLDYPDSIDPKVFSYHSRITRDVPVLDLRGKEDPRKRPFTMPPVIASKNGIQLRFVGLTDEGDLLIEWTGYLPNQKLTVVGVKTGKLRGPWYSFDGVHKQDGPKSKRLLYFRVELPEKIGDQVTIRIPTATSYVEFRGIRIDRLKPLKT